MSSKIKNTIGTIFVTVAVAASTGAIAEGGGQGQDRQGGQSRDMQRMPQTVPTPITSEGISGS